MPGQYLNIPIRGDRFSLSVFVKRRIFYRRTRFQTIEIFETEAFGKVLTLDGHIQLTELDEHAYHESLVHIPMMSISQPRSALVVGGGDGGVLRELCKYRSLKQIDLVEIDEGVIEASRKYLPSVGGRAFDDPRVTVHVEDAFPFVKAAAEGYELIVVDSTDTYEDETGALSEQLFTKEFYGDCLRLLSPQGFAVTQADNPIFCPYSTTNILGTLKAVFPRTGLYQAVVPAFGGMSAFCWGSSDEAMSTQWNPARAEDLKTRYLNEATFAFAFAPLGF